MKNRILFILFVNLLLVVTVNGHVPISGVDANSLESAQTIDNPTKSWAIYSSLDTSGEVDYYKFEIDQGEQIYIQLLKANRPDQENFVPSLAVMGPGLESSGYASEFSDLSMNVVVIEGQPSEAEYESFGPSNFIQIAVFQIEAPETGTYYFAVYSENTGGNYGVAVGLNESFTFSEIIFNPINVITVYLWQGQTLLFLLLPYLLVFSVGLYVYFRKNETSPIKFGVYLAGLSMLASAVSFVYQIIYNVIMSELTGAITISLFIVAIQASLAIGTLRLSSGEHPLTTSKTVKLLLFSALALFFWAGFVIGPLLGIANALAVGVQKITRNAPSTFKVFKSSS